MKYVLIALVLLSNVCSAQTWQADVSIGATGYTGDLSSKSVSFRYARPVVGVNLRYDMYNIVLRGGISYGKLAANDKSNAGDLVLRNLDFQTNILEGSLGIEINVLEPDYYAAYPYVFFGVGYYHFNPYTYDNEHQKVYLRPLSTEGQGLKEYPDRKPYSLWQFCIPFGAGYKFTINDRMSLSYEFGYRYLFTDYLDDVSKRFIDQHILLSEKGQKAVEVAYKFKDTPPGVNEYDKVNNSIRGNPKVKDGYFFNGLKLIFNLGRNDY